MKRWELVGSLVCAAAIVAMIWFLGSRNPEYFAQTDPLAWFWQHIEQRWGKMASTTGNTDITLSGNQLTGDQQPITGSNMSWNTLTGATMYTGGLPEGSLTGTLTLEQYKRLERDIIGYSVRNNVLLQRCSTSSRYCSQFFREAKQLVYADAFTGNLTFVPLFVPLSANEPKNMYTLLACLQDTLPWSDWQLFSEALYKQEWTLTEDRIVKTAQTLEFPGEIEACKKNTTKYGVRTKLKTAFIKETFGEITQIPFNVFLDPATRTWVSIPGLYDDVAMMDAFGLVK